jgi:deazaflavin-dependent oxidoreductase (nitroreductase family)
MSFVQRLGSYRWFARLGRFLVPADRFVARATKGRVVALGIAPSMTITTTGRKSGRPRTQPLVYAPDGDGFAVIGSNWGQTSHPAWSANLLAHPQAVVRLKGRTIPVDAQLVSGAERERLWVALNRVWPAYAAYERRAGGRQLRIFKLTPRD